MGRTKILTSVLLGVLTLAFIYINPSSRRGEVLIAPPPPVNNNISDSFLIGCIDNGQDADFDYIAGTLGFNLWHKYCGDTGISGKRYPTGWVRNGAPGDNLFAGYNDYVNDVRGVLDEVSGHNMKALLHRPKIEYLCYGQRSDYQCEEVSPNNNYWFYSFNEHNTGIPDTDSGQGVIHCRASGNGPNHDDSGFVVKRLKANTEQCNGSQGNDAYRWDYQCDWLIKPRIRIDSNFAHNNLQTSVCSIKVIAQDGQTVLKNTIIKGINFIDDQGNYNGRYLEEFYNFQTADDSLKIHGAWGDWWVYTARGNAPNDDSCNRADIQVYWYGNCDMWIDYVRVDNDIAHNLFSTDPTNLTHRDYMDWLQWEAQAIGGYGSAPLQFYIELFEFNQIPCIAYVNHKLDSLSGGRFNVMGEVLTSYQYHMPASERGSLITPEKLKDMYFDKTASKQVFVGDPYPITAAPPEGCGGPAQFSRIPETLPWTGGDSILASVVSPSNYDAWLQSIFDTTCSWYEGNYSGSGWPPDYRGVFRYLMKHGDAVSKECDLPLIVMLQAHQWVTQGEVDREPTNEELDVMTNMAVSYGARGIIYWGITSFYVNECDNSRGIMKSDVTPRETNVYGQPKLEKFQETVGRLKTWGPTLMSFNNADRQSYIYRLERTDLINETYFKDIVTYKPGSGQPSCYFDDPGGDNPPGMVYECYEERFVQAAVFKQDGSDTPYFMIVNRRCSPVKSGYPDGKRYIRIAFDANSQSFPVYRTWKIIDIAKDDWGVEFDKTTGSLINLGEFEPGEGKLYKIVPAE